jgi:hypothetical protein
LYSWRQLIYVYCRGEFFLNYPMLFNRSAFLPRWLGLKAVSLTGRRANDFLVHLRGCLNGVMASPQPV